MTSFLISALARKFSLANPAMFRQAHPHSWIVWEPAGVEAAGGDREHRRDPGADADAGAGAGAGRGAGDGADAQRGREGQVAIGRGTSCDVEINDATLSNVTWS